MSLEPGTILGHYEVVSSLGAGGMGEVYRAKDTKLGREVAIKLLLDEVSCDPERLARFEREARVLASLNHKNIASLHAFEREGDTGFLVMELVEGETLADRIAHGPIPVDEAIPLFLQIAEGLEAAHEKGVIHRDLKPANIKITDEGQVKILDFGLAKAMAPELDTSDPAMSQSPTLTLAATQRGEVLGTAAYMSPEQARGKTVDKRADVWAFGVCLFEALSGKRVFEAEDASLTLAAVLRAELEWERLATTPRAIQRLLRRCLKREPSERLRDIGDARFEIEEARQELASGPATRDLERRSESRVSRTRTRVLVVGLTVISTAAISLAAWSFLHPPDETSSRVSRFVIDLPAGDNLTAGFGATLALSPDGGTLVYVASRADHDQLFLRPLVELAPTPIAGTDGARNPFFSPNGEWVGFLANTQLKKVAVRGGSPMTLGDWPEVTLGATWTEGGTIVLGSGFRGLVGVPEDGGVQEAVTSLAAELGQRGHVEPSVLPGERGLLFSVQRDAGAQVAVLSFDSGESKTLTDGLSPRYIDTGHIIFARANSLWAAPFDLDQLELRGTVVPVLDGLQVRGSAAQYVISDSGTLFYLPPASQAATLVWVDRAGRPTAILDEPGAYRRPRLSPNGKSVVLERVSGSGVGVWVHDLDRGTRIRLTPEGLNLDPVWSANGERIVFQFGGNLHEMAADGSGEPELLLDRENIQAPHSWSPDGRLLAFYDIHPETSRDIWVLPMDEDREPVPMAVSSSNERSPAFSPDGRWLAYVSDEAGRDEIWVRSLEREEGRRVISTDGGTEPVWSPAGDELFYRNGDRMMVTSVELGETFEATSPQLLFEGDYVNEPPPSGSQTYDVSRDGQRFLMTQPVEQPNSERIIVVQNWFEELKRLVPTD